MTAGVVLGDQTFPGSPDSVARARSFVESALGDRDPRTDTAVLLTSEAVTNSIVHSKSGSGGQITVVLIALASDIRIEVIDDGGPTVPTLSDSDDDPLSTGGRGLHLIDRLAHSWGHFTDDGLTFWFVISDPDQLRRA